MRNTSIGSTPIRGFLAAATLLFTLQAGTASAQDIRVLLLRSPDARAVPPDAWRTFRQAVADAARA